MPRGWGKRLRRWRDFVAIAIPAGLATFDAGWAWATNPWAQVTRPSTGDAEAIGSYEAGCLAGGVPLPRAGPGYQAFDGSRQRQYGHPSLVAFVQTLGHRVQERHLGILAIGDLSQPRGGPMPSSHRSHQIGLDIDVRYPDVVDPTGEPASATEKKNTGRALLLQAAAEFPEVERILVNATIKRTLCADYKGMMWLRKLRPWWGHLSHFHVRLACPEGNDSCRPQQPVPPGDGCDASLAWWFTEEAAHPERIPEVPPPPLPSACTKLLAP